ncbi:MAG: GGDEF domain-containing protein [Verrucomicrobiaceae bacterium]|nr:GGDEF domain-containing protein [Verrucomicrobiaceae bacterium]
MTSPVSINLVWLIVGLPALVALSGALGWLLCRKRTLEMIQFGHTDMVTEVSNLAEFQRCLRREIERSKMRQSALSLILLDLDGLHQINEQHGYSGGDRLLRGFASFIKGRVRPSDVVARYRQGDEFAILAPDTTEHAATELVDQFRRDAEPYFIGDEADGMMMPVRFSAGIAAFDAKTDDPNSLQDKAEAALASAKKSNKSVAVQGS